MIYKLNLSNKGTIHITEEELTKFKENIGANFIEFSEGIVNPSFVVSITKDVEASREAYRKLENNRLRFELAEPTWQGTPESKEMLVKHKKLLTESGILPPASYKD